MKCITLGFIIFLFSARALALGELMVEGYVKNFDTNHVELVQSSGKTFKVLRKNIPKGLKIKNNKKIILSTKHIIFNK